MRGTAPGDTLMAQPGREGDLSALSRRRFVRNAAVAAALTGTGVAASNLLQITPADASAGFVPNDQDLHLLRRATWGATPDTLKQIRHLGRDRWLDQQLDPNSLGDAMVDDLLADRFPDLDWSMMRAWTNLGGSYDTLYHLAWAALARALWSKRQLLEVMVDFWSNHINVAIFSDSVWWSRHDYDRQVIRKHALGKYSDMLAASAQHPSMLVYLNNAESSKYGINENYGRELLELHTVGVDGGYTEDEMVTSAKIMTGFTIDWSTGQFVYEKDWHYTGPVEVLAFHSKNASGKGGKQVALDYVDYLAHHPKTAERIAYKLCERFVSDTPSKGLVSHLAHTYRAHDTAIKPVLHELFDSSAFRDSIGQKVRRPLQDVIATMRVLGLRPEPSPGTHGLQALLWEAEEISDAPYEWPQPNGYPDYADAWRSAGGTLSRWNTHMSAAASWWPFGDDRFKGGDQDSIKARLLPKPLPKTYGKLVNDVASRLVFRELPNKHRDAVLTFFGKVNGDHLDKGDSILGWRFPYLVALILDSPYHGIR